MKPINLCWLWALFSMGALLAADPDPAAVEFFEARVRPVLADRCFECHTDRRLGGLEIESRRSLLRGGNSGPAIVPGKPEQSLLIQAVSHTHERLRMPLNGRLGDQEIADLATWVKAGAVWPETVPAGAQTEPLKEYVITPEQRSYWAFQPVRKPPQPPVREASWVKNGIDRFVLAKLEERGLRPNPPADKRTLIRRAYLDLIGLPPTPEQVEAFVNDDSPQALATVVDQLLGSAHYGERWGRHWLDVARYSDDKLDVVALNPFDNAFRYRDWVIEAFNKDMPYDLFVKAQIAGDLLDPDNSKGLMGGVGVYALSPNPKSNDDRVDATTRGFLALTVACAQCHDHKYDPIPTKDFYALLGVFRNTKTTEFALVSKDKVKLYEDHDKALKNARNTLKEYLHRQSAQLGEILAVKTPDYIRASREILSVKQRAFPKAAEKYGLDRETLERWVEYLSKDHFDHPFLDGWRQASFDLAAFQVKVEEVLEERKVVDDENLVRSKTKSQGKKGLSAPNYYLWRDLFYSDYYNGRFKRDPDGIHQFWDHNIDRFLNGHWQKHLDNLRADVSRLEELLPPKYAYLHVLEDLPEPDDEHILIGGSPSNKGPKAPRAFLTVLSESTPKPFEKGSGRLELAEAIASPENPLTARVMVNRIWLHHFGQGIVRTPSNFGQTGDRPSHPQLLDYLAARFVESTWSMKTLHREIMLSSTYALSSRPDGQAEAVDPDNRLLWRANVRRMDVEALRDSLLFVSGDLDPTPGGAPVSWHDSAKLRRGVYTFVSRRELDPTLRLFDFPDATTLAARRSSTGTPMQQLFFLNGEFVGKRSRSLVERLQATAGDTEKEKIQLAYELVLGRMPTSSELELALQYLRQAGGAWENYARALLSSNEFVFVN